MFNAVALDSTLAGGLLTVLVFASLRFGDHVVDLLLAHRSSSLAAIEETIQHDP